MSIGKMTQAAPAQSIKPSDMIDIRDNTAAYLPAVYNKDYDNDYNKERESAMSRTKLGMTRKEITRSEITITTNDVEYFD